MVKVVGSNHFVLEAEVEELEGLLCRMAFEDKEVLDGELLLLGPSDSQAFVFSQQVRRALLVKEVEHAFVVDLEERYEDADLARLLHIIFGLTHLSEEVNNCPLGQAYLGIGLSRLVGCTFHCEGFARAGLPIGEHGSMKALWYSLRTKKSLTSTTFLTIRSTPSPL